MARTYIVRVTEARSNTVDCPLWHITWPNDMLPMGLYTHKDGGDCNVGAAVVSVMPVIAWSIGVSVLDMAVIDDNYCRIKVNE